MKNKVDFRGSHAWTYDTDMDTKGDVSQQTRSFKPLRREMVTGNMTKALLVNPRE